MRCVIRAVDPTALILVSRLLAFALLVSLVVLAGCGGGTRVPGGSNQEGSPGETAPEETTQPRKSNFPGDSTSP